MQKGPPSEKGGTFQVIRGEVQTVLRRRKAANPPKAASISQPAAGSGIGAALTRFWL